MEDDGGVASILGSGSSIIDYGFSRTVRKTRLPGVRRQHAPNAIISRFAGAWLVWGRRADGRPRHTPGTLSLSLARAALSFRWEVYGEQSRVCCLRIMCRWAQRRLGIIHPFQKVGASSRNSETVEVTFLVFVRMWQAIFSLSEATNAPVLYCGFVNMRIVHYEWLF